MRKVTDRLYSWASELEDVTLEQAEVLSRLPIVEGHVALMPDAHLGIGSTVGSVIPTKGAVIPAAETRPCRTLSASGRRAGARDTPARAVGAIAAGNDPR